MIRYFEPGVQKLDDWADDLKLGLAQDIKGIERGIKDVRRGATGAATREERLAQQKRQRELESQRGKLRCERYIQQDATEAQRNTLIEQLEAQREQKVRERALFTIEWEMR